MYEPRRPGGSDFSADANNNRKKSRHAWDTVAGVVVIVLYAAALVVLSYHTLADRNLFPSALDRLTDGYVSYLVPAGEINGREEAKRWLEGALRDLANLRQEKILLNESKMWAEMLTLLPQDITFEEIINDGGIAREMDEAEFAAWRKRIDESLDKFWLRGREFGLFKMVPREKARNSMVVVYLQCSYLSGIAPLERAFDADKMEFGKTKVATVRQRLQKQCDEIERRSEPPQVTSEARSLLASADVMAEGELCAKVNELRKDAAPAQAAVQIRFFGPLCLRRLSAYLDDDNPELRGRVWEIVQKIIKAEPAALGQINYKPDCDQLERRAAIARLAELYWKHQNWPPYLQEGLKYIY